MAFPTIEYQNKLAVQQFANALYDVQVGSETMGTVLSEIDQYGMDTAFNAYYNASFGSMSDADVAAMMVANLGIDAANTAAAEAYVAAQLAAAPAGEKGAAAYDIIQLFAGLEDDPVLGADATAWNAEVDMAMNYSGEADINVGVVAPFVLTAGIDTLMGSTADDYFDAPLAQAGGVTNSLSSSDHVDGGAGADTLNAVLVPEFFGSTGDYQVDVQPEIRDVETIQLEVQDTRAFDPNDDHDDDLDGADGDLNTGFFNNNAVFDAKDVTGVDSIGSYFSDGDLVIENLTTLNDAGVARNTVDLTVTMDHTDNFNSDEDASDLTVFFDEDYLLSGQTTTSSAVGYYLLDEESDDYVTQPLLNIERNGVKFILDGVEYTVQMDVAESEAADDWATYAAELQESLAELQDPNNADYNEELVGLSFVHDTDNTYFGQEATFNDDGVLVSIDPIVLIDSLGREIDGSGFISPEDATGNFDIFGTWNNDPATTLNLPVAINVDLEKVGRDGEGGNLVIGGKDQNTNNDHEEDQRDGIEVFNVSVLGDEDKPSNLGYISSTDQALKTVNIATEDTTLDSFASLTIREAFNGGDDNANWSNNTNVETVNAASFLGDFTIGTEGRMLNVDTFTATGGGDVTVWADVDGTEKGNFSMTTGAGSDDVDVTLDGDAVDRVNTSFAVTTGGAGDDVKVTMVEEGVSHNTTEDLDNLSISTGAGDDEVELVGGSTDGLVDNTGNLDGDANFNISAGTGSDFVYINSIDDDDSVALNVPAETESATILLSGDSDAGETFSVSIDGAAALTYNSVGAEAVDVYGAAIAGLAATLTYDVATDTLTYTAAAAGAETDITLTEDDATTDNVPAAWTIVNQGVDAAVLPAAAKGEWTFGAITEDQPWVDRVLYQAELTVAFAGFEETVTIDTDSAGNFIADQITINDAIKDAIDANPDLDRLLSTSDGTASQFLTVKSTVEGENGLTITVNQDDLVSGAAAAGQVSFNSGDLASFKQGLLSTDGVGSYLGAAIDSDDVDTEALALGVFNAGTIDDLDTTGAAAGPFQAESAGGSANEQIVTNYSIIDMGAGTDDLVVLNSDDQSVNTLDFTAAWGKVSVVNFFTDGIAQATEGSHIIDFTAWLDDQTDPSATPDTLSAVRTATTDAVDNAASITLASNSVVIVNDFAETATEDWEDLTASELQVALNGTVAADDFANISTHTGSVAPADLIGTSIDSMIMIENDQNLGEYKVFNAEVSDLDDTDAVAVTYVGTIDFGNTIDADAVFA